MGPHPPPPIASMKAAINPKGMRCLILGNTYFALFFLRNFTIITTPNIKRIPETIGFIPDRFCNLTAVNAPRTPPRTPPTVK